MANKDVKTMTVEEARALKVRVLFEELPRQGNSKLTKGDVVLAGDLAGDPRYLLKIGAVEAVSDKTPVSTAADRTADAVDAKVQEAVTAAVAEKDEEVKNLKTKVAELTKRVKELEEEAKGRSGSTKPPETPK